MTVTDHVGRRPLKRRIISSQEPDGRQSPRLLCARRERPRDRRAAEQRHELASSQLIGLHSVPASQGRRQDIELATSSQRVPERLYNL
jgi:hypothetical protein